MNRSRDTEPKLRAALAGSFLVSIFYGDIWLGITVPVAMLLLPFVFIVYAHKKPFARIPPGFWLLLGMTVPIAMQFALGRPLNGKSDAVVYLPIAYALATMFVLQRTALRADTMWRAFIIGGLVAAGTMMVMMLLVPVNTFLIPGQNYGATQRQYQMDVEQREREEQGALEQSDAASVQHPSGRRAALSDAELGMQVTEFEQGFYAFKRRVRTGLGQSNYVAAFFVFLFAVALFHSRWTVSILFALVAVATLSRFGVVFLGLTTVLWSLYRRGVRPILLAIGTLALGVTTMVGLFVAIGELSLPTSIAIRGAYWQKGVDVISAHPLVGAPRSYILDRFDLNILWNPHNGLLWVSALSGIVGVALYSGFLFVALREIHRRATSSPIWAGAFFGFVVLLAWSLFEPLALTPAFELLVAALYTLARNDRLAEATIGSGEPLHVRS